MKPPLEMTVDFTASRLVQKMESEQWKYVHDVMTRQEWEATQPKPETPHTFYQRWFESNQRLARTWRAVDALHVEQRGDQ